MEFVNIFYLYFRYFLESKPYHLKFISVVLIDGIIVLGKKKKNILREIM